MLIALSAAPAPVVIPHNETTKALPGNPGQTASYEQQPEKPFPYGLIDKTINEPVALFTLALVVSTIMLWRATLRIARDSRDSGKVHADKMERSATAMERVARAMEINSEKVIESVDLQQRFGRMQLRPYLTVLVGQGFYQDENLRFQIDPRILNTGHTPARDVRWRIGIEVLLPNTPRFRFPLGPVMGGNMIAPHQDYSLSALLDRRVEHADAIRDNDASKGIIIVYGCVSYRDSMKRRYLTTFAQRVWWRTEKGWRGKIKKAQLRGVYLERHNRAN